MAAEKDTNGASLDARQQTTNNSKVIEESQEKHEGYGCFSWRPAFLQFFATGRFFCIFLCWVVASDAFNSGTFGSAVTSLETRYQLPSRRLGFINSMYELASLVLVVFVVYYGGRPTSNRPLWIGLGTMLMGVGAFVTLIPQMLFGVYIPTVGRWSANETGENLCNIANATSDSCSTEKEAEDSNMVAFIIIVCGQIIVGLGWTPVMSLGMSYIDDNVKTTTSAMHIGYVQSMFGFGRIAGFLVGGVTVTKWVDFYRDDPANYGIEPKDAQWVGAWWIGLIISGIMYMLSGIPLLGFPLSIPKTNLDEEQDFMGSSSKNGKAKNNGKATEAKEVQSKKVTYTRFADIPRTFWKVLKNPLYLTLSMAFVTEFAAQIGLVIFFPKYLETQFGLTASFANLITGATLVPASALGSILGGIFVKKLKTRAEGSCKLALVLSTVAMVLLLITFGLGCETISTAGVTTPYTNQKDLNRTNVCNVQCRCENDVYLPVCGADGITYVSPCHAGCTQQNITGTFRSCSCISDGEGGTAMDGTCDTGCKTLIPFLIITFLVVLISGAEEIPQTLITMRCVKSDSKAIALGVRAVLMRLLGAIPAPLIYGAMIDTACRLWQTTCGVEGSCWLYDLPSFRYSYLGVNLIFKFLTVVFYILGWYLIRRRQMRLKNANFVDDIGDNNDSCSRELIRVSTTGENL